MLELELKSALIGYSGFVGTTLRNQRNFQNLYRSTDIHTIRGKSFSEVICAGAPAQKWLANKEPENDRAQIENLIGHLREIQTKSFILISTVDVFKNPVNVYEDSEIDEEGLQPYGLHRRLLEKFVQSHFENYLIVRLPGLVGPGLKKNLIYDFLNSNNLHAIESRGVFQFYPMVNLWYDIQAAKKAGIKVLHLTAAPISVSEIAEEAFGKVFNQTLSGQPMLYDLRSRHSFITGSVGDYQYQKSGELTAIRAYAQSEPLTTVKL